MLLLDEATSALDANTEHIVQRALNNVAVGRTVVVIAHRLSTVREADNIVVLSKGEIIEQGTHAELIELGGAYSRLVLAQDLGQEDGRDGGDSVEHEEETTAEEGNGEKAVISASAAREDSGSNEQADKVAVNYSLLKCLPIIIRERRRLWFPFAILGVAAAIGGKCFFLLPSFSSAACKPRKPLRLSCHTNLC